MPWLFWILPRIFSGCTLVVYLVTLIGLDLMDEQAYALRPMVWGLIILQVFRHAILGVTLGLGNGHY